MAELHVTCADSATVDRCLDLICAAFELDVESARPLFNADPYYRLEDKWLLWDGDRAVSTATVIPCRINMGGWEMPCAGIAGVATDPRVQRRGLATRLLTEMLHGLPARGYAAAALLASRTELYEKLGFVEAARRWSLKFELPEVQGQGYPRELGQPDWQDVMSLHARHGAHRLGALVRDEKRWGYFFWRNSFIVGVGEPLEQYMVYAATPTGVFVKELLPPGPMEPMLRFLAGKDEIEVEGWREDVDLWRRAIDGLCNSGEPQMADDGILMWKVIDSGLVLDALSRLHPEVTRDISNVSGASLGRALAWGTDAFHQATLPELTVEQRRLARLLPPKRVFSLFPCDSF